MQRQDPTSAAKLTEASEIGGLHSLPSAALELVGLGLEKKSLG